MRYTLSVILSCFFIISCGGGGGGGSSDSAPTPTVVTVSLSASSSEIFVGNEVTLTWSSSGATSCSASGSWSGTKSTSGNESLLLNEAGNYSFSLSCSGAGGNSSRSVNVSSVIPTYSLSGTINSLPFSDLDGDVPNPSLPSKDNNLDPLAVQELTNPTQIIGYASYNPQSESDDEWDIYSINLVGGQYAALETTEWDEDDPGKNDLDLHILDSNGDIYRTSTGSEIYEIVTLPAEGTYYVAVEAYSGKSRYVLTIGSIYQGFKISNNSSEVEIENNKIRILPKDGVPFTDLLDNDRYNNLNFEDESFFNFKRSGIRQIEGGFYNLDANDAELKKAIYLYKKKIERAFINPTDEQISDMILKKYISLAASMHKNFYVEPSIKFQAFGAFRPTDYFKYQWDHLAINTPEAVNAVGNALNNNVVAVLDAGSPSRSSTAYSKIDFVDGGYDFVSNDSDPTGTSTNNHGTHVAGTIASDNSPGYLNGMSVRVLPIRVLGDEGGGSLESIIEGLKYAGGESNSSGASYQSDQFPVTAINMSLGACTTTPSFCNEISNFIARTNIPIIVASGNCNCGGVSSPSFCNVATYPAQCEGVIRVAATDFNNERSDYSSYDQTVDIAAPGGDVTVDKNADGYADGVLSWDGDESVDFWQGTSMAAPHVAGAVALMKEVNPSLTPIDIDNMIIEGKMTEDIDASGKDDYTGYGLLDVAKAVDEASKFESGSSIKDTARLQPTQLKYAFTNESLDVTITKIGNGDLSITGIYADQTDGILYSAPGDGLPFGTYTFSIDRSFYTQGSYQNTFYFGLSDGTYSRIQATFAVGDPRENPNLGIAYVLLYDHETDEVISSETVDISSGSGSFQFTGLLSSKKYRISVGSDIDNDNYIGQWGEFFDSVPAFNDPDREFFSIDQNVEDVDINLVPISGIAFGALKANSNIKFDKPNKK